jgi:hypothetical protein
MNFQPGQVQPSNKTAQAKAAALNSKRANFSVKRRGCSRVGEGLERVAGEVFQLRALGEELGQLLVACTG